MAKPAGKRSLGRPTRRWEIISKIVLRYWTSGYGPYSRGKEQDPKGRLIEDILSTF